MLVVYTSLMHVQINCTYIQDIASLHPVIHIHGFIVQISNILKRIIVTLPESVLYVLKGCNSQTVQV